MFYLDTPYLELCLLILIKFHLLVFTFAILLANSADNKSMIFFFLFFPRKQVFYGDNLHEMSNPVFWEK